LKNYKAIIFDLDGTLISDQSWIYLSEQIGADVNQHKKIFSDFKSGLTDPATAIKSLIKLWKDTGKLNKYNTISIFKSIKFRKYVEDFVDNARDEYIFAIITGTMDVVAYALGERLVINNIYASSKLVFDGEELIDIDYTFDEEGNIKFKNFHKFLETNNLKAEDCIMIGDGSNDKKIFDEVGLSILVRHEFNKDFVHPKSIEVENFEEIDEILQN
jgi:HAD superfamily phosphoserine phosphatase-like hydrolase